MSIVDEEKRSKLLDILGQSFSYTGHNVEGMANEIEALMLAPNISCNICAKSDVCATLAKLNDVTFDFRMRKIKEEFQTSPFWSRMKEALSRSCSSFLKKEKTDES